MMKILKDLTNKQKELQKFNGGNFLTAELKDYFHQELIFISSTIEGVKLTRKQVAGIVRQYPEFKPIAKKDKELLQAKGQKIALEFIEDFARKEDPIDIYLIKNLHQTLMSEAWQEIAGEYRQENLEFRKSSFIPPHHSRVSQEMYFYNSYLLETQENLGRDDLEGILRFATRAHYELVRIHPFRDGNGRVARILLNLILRRFNLPYILLPKTEAETKMLKALHAGNKGDLSLLFQFNCQLLQDSFDVVLKYWQRNP